MPRSDNSAADAVAHWALDNNSFVDVRHGEIATFLAQLGTECSKCPGMLVSFDGAARGNPGKAASGVCAWWGCFDGGVFASRGLLWQKGARLGTSTNNKAEAHGLASSVKLCLHFYCWVIEHISTRAQHTMRDE